MVRIRLPPPRRSKLCNACSDFFSKSQSALTPLLLLFRKKSRSARLLGCIRPRNGSLSLPTFCELRELHSISQNRGFFAKPPVRSFRSVSFPKKVTPRLRCSLAGALATLRLANNLFRAAGVQSCQGNFRKFLFIAFSRVGASFVSLAPTF